MKTTASAIVGLSLLLAGCSDGNDNSGNTYVKLDTDQFTFDAATTEKDFDMTTNGQWSMRSDVAWCDPLTKSGNGNAKVSMWISPNITPQARKGSITILSNNVRRTISVSQPAYTADIGTYSYQLPVVFHVLYTDANDVSQNIRKGWLAKLLEKVNVLYNYNHTAIKFVMAEKDEDGQSLEEPGVIRTKISQNSLDPESFLQGKSSVNQTVTAKLQNLKRFVNIFVYTFKDNSIMGLSPMAITTPQHPLDSLNVMQGVENVAKLSQPFGCCINSTYIYDYQIDNADQLYHPSAADITLAHELGHFLGLRHTFSSHDCDEDDACDDTESCDYMQYIQEVGDRLEAIVQSGRQPSLTDAAMRTDCADGSSYVARNIMDYSYCYSDTLTAQQRQRMRHVLYYSPLVPGPKLEEYWSTTRSRSESEDGGHNAIPVVTSGCPGIRNFHTLRMK